MRRTIGSLGILCAVVLLAGCGSKKEPPLTGAQYIKQMRTIASGMNTSVAALGRVSSAEAAATALAKVQDDLRTDETKLKDMTPPAGVQTQHKQLIGGVDDFADALDPIITELKDGKVRALYQATAGAQYQALMKDLSAIQVAGYPILQS